MEGESIFYVFYEYINSKIVERFILDIDLEI